MIDFINSLSVKKFLALSVVISSILSLPLLTLFVVFPSDTKISEATTNNNEQVPSIVDIEPTGKPVITGVKPFWGKPGDEMVIWGTNFGVFPKNSAITIGKIQVTNITKWEDNQIVFVLPDNSVSGNVNIDIGNYQAIWDKPINIFNESTLPMLRYIGGKVYITDLPQNSFILYIWQKGLSMPKVFNIKNDKILFEIPEEINQLEWVYLTDNNENIIPLKINPIDFRES